MIGFTVNTFRSITMSQIFGERRVNSTNTVAPLFRNYYHETQVSPSCSSRRPPSEEVPSVRMHETMVGNIKRLPSKIRTPVPASSCKVCPNANGTASPAVAAEGSVIVVVLVIVMVFVFVSLPRFAVLVAVFVPSPGSRGAGGAIVDGFFGRPVSVFVFVTVIVFVLVSLSVLVVPVVVLVSTAPAFGGGVGADMVDVVSFFGRLWIFSIRCSVEIG